jgi:putative ABC transport system substrate-binding protein
MGYNRSWARGGALLALSCDYKDVGRQTGEIVLRVLNGENYSDLTISRPRKVKLYLNEIVADRLGIKFPKKILQKAEEVFGQ